MRYFATVADEGGISRAATKLFLAQPALSRQIHDLERTVGISLFERVHRGVHLTQAGIRLREDVEQVLRRLDDTVRRVYLAHDGRLATLRLGLSRGALGSRRIGRLLMAFRELYPDVALLVREIGVGAQAAALKANELDAAIGLGDEDDPALIPLVLFEERADSAMLATSHGLAEQEVIEPRQLDGDSLWLDSTSMSRFSALSDALARLGFEWEELEGIDTVYGYVAAGNGWTTTLSSAHLDHPAGLVVRRIRGLDVPIPMMLRWARSDDLAVVRNLATVASWACSLESDAPKFSATTPHAAGEHVVDDANLPSRSIEVEQLRAFVTFLNEGSSSAAAVQLGLTHSAVSRQIGRLERLVGVPLIARAGGRLVPTAAGVVLQQDAPAILELVDNALERARRTVPRMSRHCAIGTIPRELTNGRLVEALKQLTERYPDITITVAEGSLQSGLLAGVVDLAVVALYPDAPVDPTIATMVLQDDPLSCALLGASHPLAKRETLSPADLADETLLLVSRQFAPDAYDLVVRELRQVGLGARIGAEYSSARAIWHAVASDGGWAIGPRSLCDYPPPGVVARPIRGLSIPWAIGLQWRSREPNPVVSRVADVFRAQATTSASG